ncbi:hypothetical protein [Paenibacillus macerans]|uniref:hypothetical protein n=1 Tax=Paenibacillus macerans TaxID=44252 RepID=UPI003D313D3B
MMGSQEYATTLNYANGLIDRLRRELTEKVELISSLQEQFRQANACAARWACRYHAEETRFRRQNEEIAEKDTTIKELQEALDRPKQHLLFEMHNERTKKERAIRERDGLRKALEEIMFECGQIGLEKTYYESTEGIIKICRAALGEGEKHERT